MLKIIKTSLLIVGVLFYVLMVYAPSVSAQSAANNPTGTQAEQPQFVKNDCNDGGALSSSNCGIIKYLVIFINVLAALAGVIMVGSLVFAGIQYAASADDPNIISAAKKRIRDTIIALAAFIFMYSFLQWIIPGGVL